MTPPTSPPQHFCVFPKNSTVTKIVTRTRTRTSRSGVHPLDYTAPFTIYIQFTDGGQFRLLLDLMQTPLPKYETKIVDGAVDNRHSCTTYVCRYCPFATFRLWMSFYPIWVLCIF